MRMPGGKHRGKGKVELMMTPMIDIVFNLVIFFLLMPSFEAKEGYLPTNLPSTQGQQNTKKKDETSFRIDILHIEPWEGHNKEKAEIYLNKALVADNAALREKLHEAKRNIESNNQDIKKVPVLISPDMVVWHKHVVAAFDAAVDAGFKNIQFTVPK